LKQLLAERFREINGEHPMTDADDQYVNRQFPGSAVPRPGTPASPRCAPATRVREWASGLRPPVFSLRDALRGKGRLTGWLWTGGIRERSVGVRRPSR
jgi:hypothetical protein